MEYTQQIFCLFFGVVFKIYDDIVDNKLNINTFYIDLLKYFVITLFSIIFYNDIIFSILWFSMAVVSFLMDKYYTSKLEISQDTCESKNLLALNDNIWIYSAILSGIFIFYHLTINYSNKLNIYSYKNITLFISVLLNITIAISDIYFTPEHASDKKLYARIAALILLSIFTYYMTYYSEYIYEGNYGIMFMNIGFLTTSICFLTLDKFKMFDYLKNKVE